MRTPTEQLRQQIVDSQAYYNNQLLRDYSSHEVDRSLSEINLDLPSFAGKTCTDWIKEKLPQVQGNLVVLDLGCGTGRALADIVSGHPGKISPVGLTAKLFSPPRIPSDKIEIGDIGHVNQIFPPNTFDIIFSFMSLMYVHRHFLHIAKKTYSILKPGGLAFLDTLGITRDCFQIDDLPLLESWLGRQGYKFEFHKETSSGGQYFSGVSFQKTQDRLLLPITYVPGAVKFDPQKAAAYRKELILLQG